MHRIDEEVIHAGAAGQSKHGKLAWGPLQQRARASKEEKGSAKTAETKPAFLGPGIAARTEGRRCLARQGQAGRYVTRGRFGGAATAWRPVAEPPDHGLVGHLWTRTT